MTMRVNGTGRGVPPTPQAAADQATVQPGETSIEQVAQRLNVQPEALKSANPQFGDGRVAAGQELRLPDPTQRRSNDPPRRTDSNTPTHTDMSKIGSPSDGRRATEQTGRQPTHDAMTYHQRQPTGDGTYNSIEDKKIELDLRGSRMPEAAHQGTDEHGSQARPEAVMGRGPARQPDSSSQQADSRPEPPGPAFQAGKESAAAADGPRRPDPPRQTHQQGGAAAQPHDERVPGRSHEDRTAPRSDD